MLFLELYYQYIHAAPTYHFVLVKTLKKDSHFANQLQSTHMLLLDEEERCWHIVRSNIFVNDLPYI